MDGKQDQFAREVGAASHQRRPARRATVAVVGAAVGVAVLLGLPAVAMYGHLDHHPSDRRSSAPQANPPAGFWTAAPVTPSPDSTSTALVPGTVSAAAAYCPPWDAGRIEWPAVDEPWLASATGWAGPGSGRPVPFAATQVVICRYGMAGYLTGAGLGTDPGTVGKLEDTVNTASKVAHSNGCRIDEMTYVIFAAGTRASFFTFDLTTCNAWMMPQSVVLPRVLATRLHDLSPAVPPPTSSATPDNGLTPAR